MKKLFCLLLLAATVVSCKKDKDKDPTLEGKWNVTSITFTEYTNGSATSSGSYPGDGRTIDFQPNGSVVTHYNGNTETFTYTMMPGNKVAFDGDVYDIRELQENSVTLFLRDNWGLPTYYDDIEIKLNR